MTVSSPANDPAPANEPDPATDAASPTAKLRSTAWPREASVVAPGEYHAVEKPKALAAHWRVWSSGVAPMPPQQNTTSLDSKARCKVAVLRSGDHGKVARWRRAQALRATMAHRPDLISQVKAHLHHAFLNKREERVMATRNVPQQEGRFANRVVSVLFLMC